MSRIKLNRRQPPAKSEHRMMNLLFGGLTPEEILKKLDTFTLHKPFCFSVKEKEVHSNPTQLRLKLNFKVEHNKPTFINH